MKNATTPAQQLKQQTFKLRNEAYQAKIWAFTCEQCALSPKRTEAKRKAYANDARKKYKQAAKLYAQAAATCEAWLALDNGKGVRWWYKHFPAILRRASDRSAAASKLLK
jgi:hypothetical protein